MARATIGARRPKLSPAQQQEIVRLVDAGEQSGAEAAQRFGIHKSTVSRLVAQYRKTRSALEQPVDSPAARKHANKSHRKKAAHTGTGRSCQKAPARKTMPADWTLDAVGSARPPGFQDFPGAVHLQGQEETGAGPMAKSP